MLANVVESASEMLNKRAIVSVIHNSKPNINATQTPTKYMNNLLY